MKKIIDIIYIIVIGLMIFFGSIYVFFLKNQQDVSYIENRNLFTTATLLSNEFPELSKQEHIEHVLEDQFLFRYEIVTLKRNLTYSLSKIIVPVNNNEYILNDIAGSNNLKRVGSSNYIIKGLMVKEDRIETRVQERIKQYNDIAKRMPNVNFYVYYPQQPHESSIFDEANETVSYGKDVSDFFENQLEIPYKKLQYSTLDEYKKFFYASDHHWSHLGSYIGYLDILSLVKPDVTGIEPNNVDCSFKFYGSFSTLTGFLLDPGQFCIFDFDLKDYQIIQDDKPLKYVNSIEQFYDQANEFNDWTYLYNVAYPFDGGVRLYESGVNQESIMIVGDSYMPPVLPLLAQHFGKVFAVAPMPYYERNFKVFDYDTFIQENNIENVVFMTTIENYFFDDEYGLRYKVFDVKDGK